MWRKAGWRMASVAMRLALLAACVDAFDVFIDGRHFKALPPKSIFETQGYARPAPAGLVSVTEDPSGLDYVTSYPNYTALDDLLTVSQSGQTRSFAYDSFGRLTQATNPES